MRSLPAAKAAPTGASRLDRGGGSVIVMTLPLIPDVDPADIAATFRDELTALTRLPAQHSQLSTQATR